MEDHSKGSPLANPATANPDSREACTYRQPWVFPLLLLLVLGALLMVNRWQLTETVSEPPTGTEFASWTPSSLPTGETVRLEIDFGNGAARHFDALPWRAGMTVADVLAAAREFRPGIAFTQIGAGPSGLLIALDGLKNEGNDGRNWLYEVAGLPATESFCLQPVAPGELVRWRFTSENMFTNETPGL